MARVQKGTEGSGDAGGKAGGKGEGGKAKVSGKGETGKAGEGTGDAKACYCWISKTGCRMGQECHFARELLAPGRYLCGLGVGRRPPSRGNVASGQCRGAVPRLLPAESGSLRQAAARRHA